MKIAYVTIHVAPELMQSGAGKKIKRQISIWREHGHEVSLFSLTPSEIPFPTERQFEFEKDANILRRELNRASALKRMLVSIRDYKPDIIYLRFGLYSYPLHHIFKIAPVILEVNSNDKAEYATRGIFFYWINRLTRGFTFNSVSGVVSPTHELIRILPPGIPVSVISNGVDLTEVKPLPPTRNTNPVITLVGSPGMNWHGVDKLICFAERAPDVLVNIVGYSQEDVGMPVPANVFLHGFLAWPDLREILRNTDVACGTLALHRKNMQEACPLKVREALACGIPVVIAYHDTDLSEVTLDTVLQIPNMEDNVVQNTQRIRQFAREMIGRRVDTNFVASYLDHRKKEADRLAFFERILAGTEGK